MNCLQGDAPGCLNIALREGKWELTPVFQHIIPAICLCIVLFKESKGFPSDSWE